MEAPAGLTCCQVEAESFSSDWVQGEAQLGQTRAAVEDGCAHGQGGVGPWPVGKRRSGTRHQPGRQEGQSLSWSPAQCHCL